MITHSLYNFNVWTNSFILSLSNRILINLFLFEDKTYDKSLLVGINFAAIFVVIIITFIPEVQNELNFSCISHRFLRHSRRGLQLYLLKIGQQLA